MFKEYLKSKQNEIIGSVLESVSIPSVEEAPQEGMPFGKPVNDALEHALKLAEDMGFRTANIDNMCGYAEYGEGEEMVAVLGHLDVVPAGDDWTYDPWGEIVGDRIYGRGTMDDKGPVIGALYALDAVRALAGPLNRRIRIIFGTNEETGSRDMVRYNKTEETPVMGFTPDADYPVIFSEKGIARVVIEKEITDGSLVSAKAGNAVNIVPAAADIQFVSRKGTAEHVTGTGIPAHGSTPELGRNAIAAAMEQVSAAGACGDFADFAGFYNKCIGYETDGRALGVSHESEKFGAATVNAGLLEGDDSRIKITLDCRFPADQDFEAALEKASQKGEEYGVKFTLIKKVEPLYIPEDSVLVRTLQGIYEEQTGDKTEPIVIGGGTYAKAVKNIVAFGPLFPGQENVIHQKDEYITIEHLMKNIEIMAHAMWKLGLYTLP